MNCTTPCPPADHPGIHLQSATDILVACDRAPLHANNGGHITCVMIAMRVLAWTAHDIGATSICGSTIWTAKQSATSASTQAKVMCAHLGGALAHSRQRTGPDTQHGHITQTLHITPECTHRRGGPAPPAQRTCPGTQCLPRASHPARRRCRRTSCRRCCSPLCDSGGAAAWPPAASRRVCPRRASVEAPAGHACDAAPPC